MKVLSFLLLLSMTTLAGAQTLPSQADTSASRPLNLSVRKHLAPVSDATVILVDPKAQATDVNAQTAADSSLPYGSGFESRLQGSGSAGSAGNAGGGAGGGSGGGGSSGNGGGGRGGSGRGR